MAVLAGGRGAGRRLPRARIPVTGGNVSFYNQTGDVPIHPTPVVAVLGVIDDVARRVPSGWQDPGDNVYLLGTTSLELDGSAWARRGARPPRRAPPVVDLGREKALGALLAAAATRASSTPRTTSPTAGWRRRWSSRACASASG